MELRGEPRIKIRMAVELITPQGDTLILYSKDMSCKGLYLHAEQDLHLDVGDKVTLRLRQPVGEGSAPRVRARVIHVKGQGLGLEFLAGDE
jgi:hypothetical protein